MGLGLGDIGRVKKEQASANRFLERVPEGCITGFHARGTLNKQARLVVRLNMIIVDSHTNDYSSSSDPCLWRLLGVSGFTFAL